MQISVFQFAAVVQIFHKGGDIGAASFASVHTFNVLDGETANTIVFDAGISLVQVNNVFIVQGFNDSFFFRTKKGDEIVFGDEVVHFWLWDKISEKGEKSRVYFNSIHFIKRKNLVFHLFKGFSLFTQLYNFVVIGWIVLGWTAYWITHCSWNHY